MFAFCLYTCGHEHTYIGGGGRERRNNKNSVGMVENQVTATLPQKEIREARHSPAKLHLHWETHALKWTNLCLKKITPGFREHHGEEEREKKRMEEGREGEQEGGNPVSTSNPREEL